MFARFATRTPERPGRRCAVRDIPPGQKTRIGRIPLGDSMIVKTFFVV
jgi:hypothetical protein